MNMGAAGTYGYSDGVEVMPYQFSTDEVHDMRWAHNVYAGKHSTNTNSAMSPTAGPNSTTIYSSSQIPWASNSYYRGPSYRYAQPHPAAYGSYTQSPTASKLASQRGEIQDSTASREL